jgi:hypothetical protein
MHLLVQGLILYREAAMKAVITAHRDELPSLMEPLLLSGGHREFITDLAFALTQRSAGFRASLLPNILSSLADLVRSMNCYYSNLIEGYNTHRYREGAKKRIQQRCPKMGSASGSQSAY